MRFLGCSGCLLGGFYAVARQGSRLILPTGRTSATSFLSWLHEHIIWSQIFIFFYTTFD